MNHPKHPAKIADGIDDKTENAPAQDDVAAIGNNAFAIPQAAGAFAPWGVLLTWPFSAVLMSASPVIVASNARFRRIGK
ncbi:MAG: hypothetical protein ABI222_04485 [Opitutaceae bacterium]